MPWVHRINRLGQEQKEGLYRTLIPASLYHRFGIDPLSLRDAAGRRAVRFFCPHGDRTCLVELRSAEMEDALYSVQLSDAVDLTQIDWDFFVVNDPQSQRFCTNVDDHGKDTLFGWASRNLAEEIRALEAGLFPGQVRRGLRLTADTLRAVEFFCRTFDIRSIRLEALFYHNAITFERHGFSYFSGYAAMKRIHKLFRPGGKLFMRLDNSTPFRRAEFAGTVRGRSWAIHDGILAEIDDEHLKEGWGSPVMYRMLDQPRSMTTFPNPVY